LSAGGHRASTGPGGRSPRAVADARSQSGWKMSTKVSWRSLEKQNALATAMLLSDHHAEVVASVCVAWAVAGLVFHGLAV
jgi:hypothetical protein